MKKKKVGIIAGSVAAIAVCSSMIVGSTLALFTSEDKVNIAVTSGKLDVTANVNKVYNYPAKSVDTNTLAVEYGTKESLGDELNNSVLNNMKPGDKVEVELGLNKGETSIDFKYRVSLEKEGNSVLTDNLLVGIDGVYYSDYVSAWMPGDEMKKSVTVTIIMPAYLTQEGLKEDRNCNYTIKVEAIQGNASVSGEAKAKVAHLVNEQADIDKLFDGVKDESNAEVGEGDTVVLMQKMNEVSFGKEAPIGTSFEKFTVKGCDVGTLTVNAPASTIDYLVKNTEIIEAQAVAPKSLHIYGNVTKELNLKEGRVVLEAGSKVAKATVAPEEGKEAKLEIAAASEKAEAAAVSELVTTGEGAKVENNGTIENNTVSGLAAFEQALMLGGTVVLNSDIDCGSGNILVEKNVIIDLNGHTVTGSAQIVFWLGYECVPTVVIKNGNIAATASNGMAVYSPVNSTVTLENVKIVDALYGVYSNGSVNVSGGEIKVRQKGIMVFTTGYTYADTPDYIIDVNVSDTKIISESFGVELHTSNATIKNVNFNTVSTCVVAFRDTNLEIDNCIMNSAQNCGIQGNGTIKPSINCGINTNITVNNCTINAIVGIYHPQTNGKLTVNGGSITGSATGIEVRAGSLELKGGVVVTSTSTTFAQEPNGNGSTVKSGAALAVSQHTTNDDITVTLNGCELNGVYALYEKDVQDNVNNAAVSIIVNEGITFNGYVYSENCANIGEIKNFLPAGVTEETFVENSAVAYANGKYFATLKAAIESGADKIYLKPYAKLTEAMTHAHVTGSVTLYGNRASLVGAPGEHDLEVDTYNDVNRPGLTGDITVNIYNLDGIAVWGQRTTNFTININIKNCKDIDRIYISGTTGVNNINLENCSASTIGTGACKLYSNAEGTINVTNCKFERVSEPINLNNKSGKVQNIYVKDCTFTDCSIAEVLKGDGAWAAPIRVIAADGISNLHLSGNTFVYSEGNEAVNGNILTEELREDKKPEIIGTVEVINED